MHREIGLGAVAELGRSLELGRHCANRRGTAKSSREARIDAIVDV